MFDVIVSMILDYIPEVLAVVFTTIGAFVLSKIKEKINTETKKDVVRTTVKYIEQVYKDIHGDEKLQIAKDNALELLNEKGIHITELELTAMIESVLAELNGLFKEE